MTEATSEATSPATVKASLQSLPIAENSGATSDKAPVAVPPASAKAARKSTFASSLASTIFVIALVSTLYIAWKNSGEEYIVPDTGIGYWLGIAGGVVILSVLLYPLRKRHAGSTRWGKIAKWFKLHMVMGTIGPALIIIHSNFELQSINATVAMGAMLLVVTSGVIGRFLYSKIHKGLYGTKTEVRSLVLEAEALQKAFGDDMEWAPEIMDKLKTFKRAIIQPDLGVFQSLRLIFEMSVKTRTGRRSLMRDVHRVIVARAKLENWDSAHRREIHALVREHLDQYFWTVRKAAGLKFYSRLFGLWHTLHVPIYILLIIAAIVHIIAVHLY